MWRVHARLSESDCMHITIAPICWSGTWHRRGRQSCDEWPGREATRSPSICTISALVLSKHADEVKENGNMYGQRPSDADPLYIHFGALSRRKQANGCLNVDARHCRRFLRWRMSVLQRHGIATVVGGGRSEPSRLYESTYVYVDALHESTPT